MRATPWLGFLGTALVVAAAGCAPKYPNCNSDEHCQDHNEVCVQGQCQECATDANCKSGFVCQGSRCVPRAECTDDSGCGGGRKCRSGRCVTETARPAEGSCATNNDCRGGEECQNGRCVAATATCRYEPVSFEFNEASLSASAQSQLAQLADCIKRENAKLTAEGHADERGTEEYNLQLSNRRAASVKRYLTDLGVPANAIETVGFGENRPAQQGSSEAAWAANRRVEFSRR